MAQAVEVLQRAVDEDVVPAVEVERRHLDLPVARAQAPALPVGVIVGMLQPIVKIRRDALVIGKKRREVLQWQEPVPFGELVRHGLVHHRVDRRAVGIAAHVAIGDRGHRPILREGLVERAALIGPTVVIIGRGHRRNDGDQVWRLNRGGQELRRAWIGEAVHTYLAVRLRKAGGPLDGVVAVVGFVDEGIEEAVRLVLAAHVLRDDDVAMGGVEAGRGIDVRLRDVLVVGEPQQDDGIGTGLVRCKYVGAQNDAVAHRGGHVLLHRIGAGLAGCGRRRCQRCEQREQEEGGVLGEEPQPWGGVHRGPPSSGMLGDKPGGR